MQRATGTLPLGVLGLCLALETVPSRAAGPAGIKLDGTLGPSAAALAGPMYAITQNLGKLSGGNLYFSFQYFNVATGETALFSTTSAGINNVISRVTGGYASTIDGTIELQAAAGSPNFFLINPSGVTFTANAVIDVPAAFYVSTANYLKFSDGNFYVDPGKMSTLSAAAPEAFGFLGTTRAAVNIEGAVLVAGPGDNGAGAFQIAAGDVSIEGTGAQAGIYSSTGEIQVTAVGSASAEVPLSGPFAATDGTVTIINGGLLWSQGFGATAGGGIAVNAGSLLIDGQDSTASTGIYAGYPGAPGPVTIAIGHDATILSGGVVRSYNAYPAAAANVSLSANSLTIDGGNESSFTGILSEAVASGSGGSLQVSVAGAATISDGGDIYSLAEGAGNGGNIQLSSGTLTIDGGNESSFTGIESVAAASGSGGSLQVTVAGAATISDGGDIYSLADGAGNGGNITLSTGALQLEASDAAVNTLIEALTYGSGNSGSVQVAADSLTMTAPLSITLLPVQISTGTGVGSSGSAGPVDVQVSGNVSLAGAAAIDSNTNASGNAGQVSVQALGTLSMGDDAEILTATNSGPGNGGNLSVTAGALDIASTATASITNIVTLSYTAGNAGAITIHTGSLSIDGAASNSGFTGIESFSDGAGAGGAIQINVTGAATIANGGQINSAADAQGNAGNIVMSAGKLLLQDSGNASTTGVYEGTYGAGSAGAVQVTAGALTMIGPASASANPVSIENSTQAGATGVAGNINIDVSGNISLTGGAIASNTYSSAAGGQVTVKAVGTVSLLAGASIDAASTATGNAGGISLTAAALDIAGQASTAETGVIAHAYQGNAGDIQINVGTLSIDGGPGPGFADIDAATYGAGAGGQVRIDVTGSATLVDNGFIVTDTSGQGNAGNIDLTAANLVINGQTNTSIGTGIEAGTYGAGNAGSIHINAGSLTMTGYEATNSTVPAYIESGAEAGSSGAAGDVTVDVTGNILLSGEAQIGSDTFTPQNSGRVVVNAGGGIYLSDGGHFSSISNTGSGSSGDVSVTAATLDIEGQGNLLTGISTESFGSGGSGNIRVQVGSLLINGGGAGGSGAAIDSEVYPEGTGGVGGAGGSIVVAVAGNATLENGSKISTTSYGSGPAGDVSVSAGSLVLGGGSYRSIISSGARAGSGGQPGNVTIDASTLEVLEDGSINIADEATVSDPDRIRPTRIAITAGQIDLDNGLITAASTGNVAASSIDINYGSGLRMDPSTISTSSQDGNGGPITITGAGPLLISHSDITTSVLGTSNGNGGDITINVPVIALDTGAIQANTFAPLASGGTVTIDAQALVPSYQSYILGGSAIAFDPTVMGLNVVQAAAPDGVSGALSVTVPTLDLGNALLGLTGKPSAPATLGRDLCGATRGSSLAIAGRGGVAPTAYDPLRIDPGQALHEAAMGSTVRKVAAANADDIAPGALVGCR
jgi:filamentous hemagglutinin family protein